MTEVGITGTILHPALPGDALMNATLAWLLHQKSDNTRRSYQRFILGIGNDGTEVRMKARAWLPWCQDRGVDPLAAGLGHVDLYAKHLIAAGLADRSQAAMLAAVSSWYRYLIKTNVTTHNPASGSARPNIDPDDATAVGLDEDETNRLLDQAEADGPRTAALIAVLYFGALRVGSLLNADIRDLGWGEGGERTLHLRVKGGSGRRIVLEDEPHKLLKAYLATRPGALPSEPLFATATGARLDEPYVWRLIRRLARRARIDSAAQLNPHSLRHSHITHAFDEKVDGAVIQGTAGHKSFTTTIGYDIRRKKRLFRSGTVLSARRQKAKGAS